MEKKDQSALKKALGSIDLVPVDKIASAYADIGTHEIRLQKTQMFHRIDDYEAEQYCSFFKKGVSGKIGTLATEVNVSEDNPLEVVLSEDFSEKSLQDLYQKITESRIASDNYGILLAKGSLDLNTISKKKKNDDEEYTQKAMYEFLLVLISPCMLGGAGIIYDSSKNVFKDKIKQNDLKPPTCAFLYPSLTELEPDTNHAMCFAKSKSTVGEMADIAAALFGTDIASTPEIQEQGFQDIVNTAYPNGVPYEPMQEIYKYFDELKEDSETEGTDINLVAGELADAVIQSGDVSDEDARLTKETAADYNNVNFSVGNLAPKNITIETDYAVIKTDLHDIPEIQRKMIDGEEYLLIPARNVSIENIRVK